VSSVVVMVGCSVKSSVFFICLKSLSVRVCEICVLIVCLFGIIILTMVLAKVMHVCAHVHVIVAQI